MPHRIWDSVLPLLSHELAKASFSSFIEVLEPVAIQGNSFIVEAPTDFVKATIRERYAMDIAAALSSVTSRNYELVVIVPSEREKYEARIPVSKSTLNPRYTFDSFVIGPSNRFAHAVAKAVADKPGKDYNPLFIYGGVGLGKTHLMHAIGNSIADKSPYAKIMYVTSERFTNELIVAIQRRSNEEFRKKYRTVDILLVDDIQFFADKEGTLVEFFHTFNALYEESKQIIISSDKPPKDIPMFDERLRSRFEQGLIADILPPDYETRVAILWKKALADNLSIPDTVLQLIASRVERNIRELEGALTRVTAYASIVGEPVTVELAEEALKDYFPRLKARAITPALVAEIVADYYQIDKNDLMTQKRSRDITLPRQVAMFLLREHTDLSLMKIAEFFNRHDHTTVMYAYDKIATDVKADSALKTAVEDLSIKLKE